MFTLYLLNHTSLEMYLGIGLTLKKQFFFIKYCYENLYNTYQPNTKTAKSLFLA